MGRWLVLFLCAGFLHAQAPRAEQPEPLVNDVETSILSRDLVAAYDAAARLDDTVQALLRASLARDATFIANQLLTWLPPAWDSFVFDQRAFVVGEKTPRADVALMTSRLARLNGGAILSALRGSTVRIAAAGVSTAVPASAAYFYFFDANLNARLLGNPDLSILGRPFWRTEGGGEYWLTLARPDLLIVASSRDLAAGVLGRVLNGSSTRALPAALPEWGEVDRKAALWGLRHSPDSAGGGIALNLDASQKLEVRCLCSSRPAAPQADFQSEQPRRGLWVLRSDLGARGDPPLSFAFGLLGWGDTE